MEKRKERFNLEEFEKNNVFAEIDPETGEEMFIPRSRVKKQKPFKRSRETKAVNIPISTVRQIKRLFFEGYSIKKIGSLTGVSFTKIHRLIQNPNRPTKTWAVQKEEMERARVAILVHALRDDALEMREVLRLGTKAIKTYLLELNENLQQGIAKLDTKEAKLISDLIANVHRIESLELNKPTEIIVERDISKEEIQALIPEVIRELQALDPGINYLNPPIDVTPQSEAFEAMPKKEGETSRVALPASTSLSDDEPS